MAKNSAQFQLIGDKELIAAFESLKSNVQSRTMHAGMRAASEPILDSAKAILASQLSGNPYREKGKLVGNLLRSLAVKTKKYASSVFLAVIGPQWPEGAHGHLFEFGTRARTTGKDAYRGIVPARPFLRPAFDSNVRIALDILTTFVRNRIMRARLTVKK